MRSTCACWSARQHAHIAPARRAHAILVTLVAAIALCTVMLGAPIARAQSVYPVRLGGDTRYDTMAQVSRQGWANGSCNTAIVVSGENFPDALTADALAGFYGCPVLTTEAKSLSPQCASEIRRLGAKNVVILGGPAAVSSGVERSIKALGGIATSRVYGTDRVATSLAVFDSRTDWSTTAIVCKGTMFPGALSIAPYAFANHSPVLLANDDGHLTAAEKNALQSGGFSLVVFTGGGYAESDEAALKAAGVSTLRLAGADRYETSEKIAAFVTGTGDYSSSPHVLSYSTVGIARGDEFPDGLSGGALLGKEGAVQLLSSPEPSGGPCIDDAIRAQSGNVGSIVVLGGTAAVSEVAADMAMIRAGLWHPSTLQFISDLQLENDTSVYSKDFVQALKSIRAIEPSTGGIAIVGDTVQDASQYEYGCLSKLIEKGGFSPTDDITYAAGNHELNTVSSKEGLPALRSRFMSVHSLSGMYYSKYVGGMHLIVLGSDSPVARWTSAHFSDAQLAWLDKQLAADKAAGVVSYVLCHQPFANTVDGSQDWTGSGNSIENLDELKAVTDKYPNAIIFSGHSHYPIDIARPSASGPLYVGTGTIAYIHDSTHTPRCQGWFVYALDDRVVFLGRDFLSDSWIDSYIYYK